MGDMILFTVILIAVAVWACVGAWEAVYNRCKRRADQALLTDAIDTLSQLQRRHAGWDHGMGACVCEQHRKALDVIKRYHERGKPNG